jgi:hypothetical protein
MSEDKVHYIPGKLRKYEHYVVVSELPVEHQKPFNDWLIGQTRPFVESEGENQYNCAYKWDYLKWLGYWIKGKTAPIYD